jgi:hypothetical protein
MAVLDQDLGDLHRAQRAIGGAVEGLCPRRRQGLPERTQWRSATVDALDETAIERYVAEVAGKQAA